MPSKVLTAVRDLTRDFTAATPEPYLLIKDALLSRFTSLPLQMCFKLLGLPPLGDRRPSALFTEMQSLLPRDANVLFNAMFLRRLPEAISCGGSAAEHSASSCGHPSSCCTGSGHATCFIRADRQRCSTLPLGVFALSVPVLPPPCNTSQSFWFGWTPRSRVAITVMPTATSATY